MEVRLYTHMDDPAAAGHYAIMPTVQVNTVMNNIVYNFTSICPIIGETLVINASVLCIILSGHNALNIPHKVIYVRGLAC